MPVVRLVLELKRDFHLDLVMHAEALFMNNVGSNSGSAAGVHSGRDHDLVFRKRLFRDQRARQVEFAAGPTVVMAERPQVGDYVINLIRLEQLAEGGHDLREAARRAAVDDYVFPRRIGLWCGLITTREIRESVGTLELSQRLRRATAIAAVTGDTSRLINALAILYVMGSLPDSL